MIIETIPALGSLTADQKLRLVWELWHDVSRDTTVSVATGDLLDERLAEHSAAPDDLHTTDEVTAGIMALKQRISASRK